MSHSELPADLTDSATGESVTIQLSKGYMLTRKR